MVPSTEMVVWSSISIRLVGPSTAELHVTWTFDLWREPMICDVTLDSSQSTLCIAFFLRYNLSSPASRSQLQSSIRLFHPTFFFNF